MHSQTWLKFIPSKARKTETKAQQLKCYGSTREQLVTIPLISRATWIMAYHCGNLDGTMKRVRCCIALFTTILIQHRYDWKSPTSIPSSAKSMQLQHNTKTFSSQIQTALVHCWTLLLSIIMICDWTKHFWDTQERSHQYRLIIKHVFIISSPTTRMRFWEYLLSLQSIRVTHANAQQKVISHLFAKYWAIQDRRCISWVDTTKRLNHFQNHCTCNNHAIQTGNHQQNTWMQLFCSFFLRRLLVFLSSGIGSSRWSISLKTFWILGQK